MLSSISSTAKKIWKKMGRKAYRDAFVGAHVSNTVASQIAVLRAANGWTQTELAKQAGMKQSRISALEDPNYENIEVRTLRRLASAFDVALTVRFIPFSELAYWSDTLSESKLLVPKFEEDELGGQVPLSQPSPAASAIVGFQQLPTASTLQGVLEFLKEGKTVQDSTAPDARVMFGTAAMEASGTGFLRNLVQNLTPLNRERSAEDEMNRLQMIVPAQKRSEPTSQAIFGNPIA
jgi:transcriptional regulator with XRE-family HTH domain